MRNVLFSFFKFGYSICIFFKKEKNNTFLGYQSLVNYMSCVNYPLDIMRFRKNSRLNKHLVGEKRRK